ncbi:MAG: SMP-30/gluconolactonase/LRE family protein [Caulobacter sp.]|nr:SMP-30/gluconolactonase/LRE family protein [Caulobacter sp.]
MRRLSPALDAVIAPDASIQLLAEGFVWSEGPVWVREGGCLVFSDVPGNVMYRWSETDGVSEFLNPSGYDGPPTDAFAEPGQNGMALDAAGYLLACDHGNRALVRIDLKTRAKTFVVDRHEGKRFNSPNDLAVAKSGAIYFTDPTYGLKGRNASPLRELDFNGVYRLRPDGTLDLLDTELTFPNGVALSPDEQRLYVSVSDPQAPKLWVYELGPDGLPVGKTVFFDTAPLKNEGGLGLPDGMCLDTEGRLYATGPGGVLVITPRGELIGAIETGTAIANCAFGEDGSTLFLASHDKLARVRLKTRGLVW